MRSILGKPDCPDSSYILVLRGIGSDTLDYLYHHVKKYPTWGCVVFPEEGVSDPILKDVTYTPIHRVLVGKGFSLSSDDDLIKYVKENFPAFSEDEKEPFYTGSPDMDHMASFSKRIKSVNAHSVIPRGELRRWVPSDRDYLIEDKVAFCKSMIIKRLFDTPDIWDISTSTDEITGDISVCVSMDVGIHETCTKAEPLVDAVKGNSDTIKSLGRASEIISKVGSGENKDFML